MPWISGRQTSPSGSWKRRARTDVSEHAQFQRIPVAAIPCDGALGEDLRLLGLQQQFEQVDRVGSAVRGS